MVCLPPPHTHTIGVFNQSCGCQSWKLNIQPCTNIHVSNSTHQKKKKKKNLITLKHFHTHTNILWKPNLSETSIALSGRLTTRTDLFSTLDDQRTHFLIRTPTINLLGTVPLPASRVARGAPHHVSSLKAKVERSGSAWRRAVTLTPDPGYLL